ncbi:polygalacturonase [Adhaeribacter aerolatus]|uniref:Polygalacturonase n=1 Tax=Adhaeribacter aerolatus TaxID=670289 RepID=A0A512B5V6_9BACT|nr:polygalacturonase [Adhaeribacter aerolatus]
MLTSCGKSLTSHAVKKQDELQIFDVTKFGAVGDSVTVNTKAIQRALDECYKAGGGIVLIPKGVYSSGALFLKSNVHLKLDKEAKLRAVAGLENFPELKNTRIAGIHMNWPSAFINALNANNIKISGEGTIDGSGYYWWEPYWQKRAVLVKTVPGDLIDWHVPRPRLILFDKVTDSEISGLRLQNSGFWTVHICYSQNIQLTDLNIFNPVLEDGKKAASTDGIDVDSSRDIFIRNCIISVDDDCIAVKSGRGSDGLRVNIPTENVVIEDCTFLEGHGGVSIGTETAGGIKNVFVRNCKAMGNKAPIKFKPRPGRGGVIENITHENWEMEKVGTVIDYALREVNGDDYIDEWQKIKVPFVAATPRYRNITIRQVKASQSGKAISFLGWPLAHAENIIMENISIEAKNGARFQYVDNLVLKNVEVKTAGQSFEFLEVQNKIHIPGPIK